MAQRPPPRRHHRPSPRSGAGGTLFGIFIGIIVGLGLAAGVAFWLIRNNPGVQIPAIAKDSTGSTAPAKGAPSDKPRFDFYKILPGVEEPKLQAERPPVRTPDRAVAEQSRDAASGKAAAPSTPSPAPAGNDKVATAPPAGDKTAVEPSKAGKGGERYWLQAGSFTAQSDAENLKARLALGGWEANVQEGSVPDKGVRYRVRMGPYDDADELNRMKAELARRGFDVAVIRY
jgi:cell division protein FtsN